MLRALPQNCGGGGGARTLPLPEPALQARPRHRASTVAAHPECDLRLFPGGRAGSDALKPPGGPDPSVQS